MNNFVKGVLVGIGVGLLVAPMKGEEMRRLLREQFKTLRANLPEKEQLSQYTKQVSGLVSQTGDTLKGYAQQAATKVQSTASDLKGLAQQAGSQVKQTGQDIVDTTKQSVESGSVPSRAG